MNTEEQSIRKLFADWHRATAAGNVAAILPLMADDVVFLVAGQAPFGVEAFEKGLRAILRTHRIESSGEIKEIRISADMAYCWSQLNVCMHPLDGGSPAMRAGNVLSVLRKQASGAWQLTRDANMLVAADGAA